jgi:DNA repair protein RadC
MARRHLQETLQRGDALTSPELTRRYLRLQLQHEVREVFAALYLDSQHRALAYEPIAHGTLDSAAVYPREVLKRCLHHHAAAVIFAHNHPSGVAEPSQADRRITERLCDALALVDIRVLDHIVVGEGDCTSFAERGWL